MKFDRFLTNSGKKQFRRRIDSALFLALFLVLFLVGKQNRRHYYDQCQSRKVLVEIRGTFLIQEAARITSGPGTTGDGRHR